MIHLQHKTTTTTTTTTTATPFMCSSNNNMYTDASRASSEDFAGPLNLLRTKSGEALRPQATGQNGLGGTREAKTICSTVQCSEVQCTAKTCKLQYLWKLCFENPGFEQMAYVRRRLPSLDASPLQPQRPRGRQGHSHCSLRALRSAECTPTAAPAPSAPPGGGPYHWG